MTASLLSDLRQSGDYDGAPVAATEKSLSKLATGGVDSSVL